MDWLGIPPRRLGTGMLLFGAVGLVIAGIIALALVGGAFAARNLDDRLAADQARIAASLTRLSVTMDSLAITTQNAGRTLQNSSDALADARDVLQAASDTSLSLAASLDVAILGNRPFASASENLGELARTLDTFRVRAEALAVDLTRNSSDADVIAGQIRDLKQGLNEVAAQVAGFDRIGEMVGLVLGGIVLVALLTAWVALGAAFCAWAGWRLRRSAVTGRSASA